MSAGPKNLERSLLRFVNKQEADKELGLYLPNLTAQLIIIAVTLFDYRFTD